MRRAALLAALALTSVSPALLVVEARPAVVVEAPADAELYRTGVWWPCWAVDVPCTEEG